MIKNDCCESGEDTDYRHKSGGERRRIFPQECSVYHRRRGRKSGGGWNEGKKMDRT